MRTPADPPEAGATGGGWLRVDPGGAETTVPEDASPTARALAASAAEFMEREVLPRSERIEQFDPQLTRELLKECGERGLLALEFPGELGGAGLGMVDSAPAYEQLARQASFAVSHGAHCGIGMLPLLYFGTPEQKRRYLPSMAAGERIGAFALTEPEAGSDALAAATRAQPGPGGDHFLLNGEKRWISNAGFADLFTVFARLEGAAGERTLTALLVERGYPGVRIGPEERKLGIRGSSTCRVYFENARVPRENLLYLPGRGHVVALNVLNATRLKLALGLIGPCRALLARSARYANERYQMGRPLSSFGLVREMLARQCVLLFALESAAYRAAGLIDGLARRLEAERERGAARDREAGEPAAAGALPPRARACEEFLVECALLKVIGSETIGRITDHAVQIHGGCGYVEDLPLARAYRDARINRIFEGTSEINRLTAAGTLLRRARSGRLSLEPAIREAVEALSSPYPPDAGSGFLAAEMAAARDLRLLLLAVMGAAHRRLSDSLGARQEILARLANMAADLFCAQSCLLRARRLREEVPGERADSAEVLARLFLADATRRMEQAAREVVSHVERGDDLRIQLALLRRFLRRAPEDTIALRDRIAETAAACEGYPLGPLPP